MKAAAGILIGVWLRFRGSSLPCRRRTPRGPRRFLPSPRRWWQLDAIVTDSKGHQVTNLTPADFQVFEDAKLQKLTAFFVRPDNVSQAAELKRRVKNRSPAPLRTFAALHRWRSFVRKTVRRPSC